MNEAEKEKPHETRFGKGFAKEGVKGMGPAVFSAVEDGVYFKNSLRELKGEKIEERYVNEYAPLSKPTTPMAPSPK